MARGDQRSRRGKIARGSNGKTRPKNANIRRARREAAGK
ncbi:30S ribosomal protein THX [Aquisalimonas lutea]|nr:30S ribosomal protein THX [Aquisalimonas lutea]MDN3518246.1 30S ribosomal protein THX [Aquisalimonas lutea]